MKIHTNGSVNPSVYLLSGEAFLRLSDGGRQYEPGSKISLYAGGGGATGGEVDRPISIGLVPVEVRLADGATYPSGTTRYWKATLVDGAAIRVGDDVWVCLAGTAKQIYDLRLKEAEEAVARTVRCMGTDDGNVHRQREVASAREILAAIQAEKV